MKTCHYIDDDGNLSPYPPSFTLSDLERLRKFLTTRRTIPMVEAVRGDKEGIVVRHDLDHSVKHGLAFAEWEAENGIRATYFLLHSAGYWLHDIERTLKIAIEIQELGHEVGIHNDAVAASVRKGNNVGSASAILERAIDKLRNNGIEVVGAADHGGDADNSAVWGYRSPQDFGLEYEAYQWQRENRVNYISDNHGLLRAPLEHVEGKQTVLLVHPCHWVLP